jgi:AsmA-like protein
MTRKRNVLTFIAAGVLTLLISAPWLVPIGSFIPSVEARASAALGQPVTIAALRLSLLPLQVTASEVQSPLIEAQQVTLSPSLWHLFSEVRVLREVKLNGVRVKPDFFRRVLGRNDPAAAGVRVRRIVFSNAELRLDHASLRSLQGTVTLAADSQVQEIRVQHQGERMQVVAKRAAGGFQLQVLAHNWTLPIGPPVAFDRIEASARLTAQSISTAQLSASLYGGTLTGPLVVTWRPGWTVGGALALDGVQVQPLARLLSPQAATSGRLQANARFIARASAPKALLRSLRLESDFRIEAGMLQRVDLEAAARQPLSPDAGEGSTRFDGLSGRLEIDDDGYHFTGLNVESGLLAATGEVSVSRDQRLDGRIAARLKGTGPLFAMPMRVSGTLQDPNVSPSKTAVAAAVAGSVLLPGIGTAVGLKAGQLTDMLFGPRRRIASNAPPLQAPAPTGRGAR